MVDLRNTYIDDDPSKVIEDAATFHLNLTKHESPEHVTLKMDKAKEMGLPYPLVAQLDNSDLERPLSAAPLSPRFQKYLADNTYKVPMFRDQLEPADSLVRWLVRAGQTRQQVVDGLNQLYEAGGVPYPRRLSLEQRGYKEIAPGKYLKDGEVLSSIATPEDAMGPEERKRVEAMMETLRTRTDINIDDLTGYDQLSEAGKKALLGRYSAALEQEVAVLSSLMEGYGEKWRSYPDDTVRELVDRIGREEGVDLSHINIDRLRKGGASTVDLAQALNFFGAVDIVRFATQHTPEQIAAIDENSPIEDQLAKIKYLSEYGLEMRGRSVGAQTAQTLVNALPFIAEVFTTRGLTAVAKQGGSLTLKAAISQTLKAARDKVLVEGGKKALKKSFMPSLKGVGSALGLVAKGEAKRLPLYVPRDVIRALDEVEQGPVYYMNNGVKVDIPEAEVEKIGDVVTRNLLSTYMENTSEYLGEFLPGNLAVSRIVPIPKKWRSNIGRIFLSDIAADKTKMAQLTAALSDAIPIDGVVGEMAEEWAAAGMQRMATVLGEALNSDALNMGRESVFGDADEQLSLLYTSLIMSGTFSTITTAGRLSNYKNALRRIDDHRGAVDRLSQMPLEDRSPQQAQDFIDEIRVDENVTIQLAPDDARILFQSDPDMLEALGVTEDAIAKADMEGTLIDIPESKLIAEQAKSPAANEAGERIMEHARINGERLKDAMSADFGKEILDAIEHDRDRLEATRERIYAKLEVLRKAGFSHRTLNAAALVISAKVIYMQDNFASPEVIDQAVDNLLVKLYKDENQFASDKDTLALVDAIVEELVPEQTEQTEQTEESEWVMPDDVVEEWDPYVRKVARSRVYSSKNEGIRQYLDEGVMYDEIMRALNKAYSKYNPESGPFEHFARVTIKNKVFDMERRAATQANKGVASLDEGVNDDGAVRADVTPDPKAEPQGSRLSKEETDALTAAINSRLTELQRVIWQGHLDGKIQSQIAEEVRASGLDAEMTRDRVQYALTKIRAIAKEEAIRMLGPLRQESPDAKSTKRGFFYPAASFAQSFKSVMGLFRGAANASTVVHESAHWLYRMMGALVEMQGEDGTNMASDQMRQEYEAINKWLDRQKYKAEKGTPEWENERDEKFARAFEEYIMHHRAPSSAIAVAFNTLKRLLTAIYRHYKSLPEMYGFEMSKDITDVFDNILAVDEIVKRDSPLQQAALSIEELFTMLFGASSAEHKDAMLVANAARVSIVDSAEAVRAAALKKMQRVWRAAANKAMQNMRVYRTWRAASKQGKDQDNRLDFGLLSTMTSPDIASALKKMGLAKEGGKDPALLASSMGYTSPMEMANELAQALPPADFVDAYLAKAEAKFDAEYELGAEALGTKANLQLVDLLIDKLRGLAGDGNYHSRRAAAVETVSKMIAESNMAWVLSDKKAVANLRAASKDLFNAFSKQDYLEALKRAETVRQNIELLRQKADVKKRAEATLRRIKRAMRAPKGRIYEDNQLALRELAYFFGLTDKAPEDAETNYRKKCAGISDVDKELGRSQTWPDWLLGDTVRNYKDLSVDEFEVFADFADSIYRRGREIVKEGKTSLHDRSRDIRDRSVALLQNMPHKYHNRKETIGEKVAYTVRRSITWGFSLRNRLGRADGYTHVGKDAHTGPLMEMWNIINEASSKAMRLIDVAERPCKEAVQKLYELRDKIQTPSVPFQGKAADYYSAWSPERVISVCLNMGNKINRQRLRDGFGWTEEQLTDIAACLPEAAWREVQRIWDAIGGELQNKVSATFFKENYYRLKLVPADEFSVRTADDKVLQVKGGYYPIKYSYPPAGKAIDLAEELRELHHESRATFRTVSSTKQRAENLREVPPLKLSMSVPVRHIYEAAMYAEMRMPLRVALGVVVDKTFRDEFQQTQSYEAYQDVYNIIRNMANPIPETEGVLDSWESWARTALTASALMMNLRTIGMQVTSATIGVQELGHYYVDALGEMASGPQAAKEFIASKSGLMASRSNYFDQDLQTRIDAFSSKLTKAQHSFAKVGYFGMHFVDGAVSSVLWLAKYRQAMDLYHDEAKAVAEADGFIARTQGASRLIDMPPIRLTRLGRLLTPFLAPANAQFNQLIEDFGAMKAGRLTGGEAMAAIACDLVGPALLTGVVTWLTTSTDDDDDNAVNKLSARIIRDVLTNPFSGMPIIGTAVQGLVAGGLNTAFDGAGLYIGDVFDMGAYQAVDKLFKGIVSGGRALADGDFARATWVWSDVISTAYKMPVIKVYKRALEFQKVTGLGPMEFQENLEKAVSANNRKGR